MRHQYISHCVYYIILKWYASRICYVRACHTKFPVAFGITSIADIKHGTLPTMELSTHYNVHELKPVYSLVYVTLPSKCIVQVCVACNLAIVSASNPIFGYGRISFVKGLYSGHGGPLRYDICLVFFAGGSDR